MPNIGMPWWIQVAMGLPWLGHAVAQYQARRCAVARELTGLMAEPTRWGRFWHPEVFEKGHLDPIKLCCLEHAHTLGIELTQAHVDWLNEHVPPEIKEGVKGAMLRAAFEDRPLGIQIEAAEGWDYMLDRDRDSLTVYAPVRRLLGRRNVFAEIDNAVAEAD